MRSVLWWSKWWKGESVINRRWSWLWFSSVMNAVNVKEWKAGNSSIRSSCILSCNSYSLQYWSHPSSGEKWINRTGSQKETLSLTLKLVPTSESNKLASVFRPRPHFTLAKPNRTRRDMELRAAIYRCLEANSRDFGAQQHSEIILYRI